MHYDNGPAGPVTYAIIRRIMTATRRAFHFANVRYLMSKVRYYLECLRSASLSHSPLPPRFATAKSDYEVQLRVLFGEVLYMVLT